jgi:hypothetical protein
MSLSRQQLIDLEKELAALREQLAAADKDADRGRNQEQRNAYHLELENASKAAIDAAKEEGK